MQFLRKILFPISILYDGVTTLRNILFNTSVFKSKRYNLPIICVGNLSVGGTGKSPMIEFLIRLLKSDYKIATLSRGYRRKTKGFILATKKDTALSLGDEPMQFHTKFPNISVAVDANRQNGIERLIAEVKPDVILLDDAYQHRKVTADFYILLTTYNDLYVDDLLLPAGNLRESKRGAKRAKAIVVTKCPPNLSEENKNKILRKIKPNNNQYVYFTKISYSTTIYSTTETKSVSELKNINFTLVTGIANPKELIAFLKQHNLQFEHLAYKDHHNFTASELKNLATKGFILTTEKDYMRLRNEISNLYYLPIKTQFLDDLEGFTNQINNAITIKKALT